MYTEVVKELRANTREQYLALLNICGLEYEAVAEETVAEETVVPDVIVAEEAKETVEQTEEAEEVAEQPVAEQPKRPEPVMVHVPKKEKKGLFGFFKKSYERTQRRKRYRRF